MTESNTQWYEPLERSVPVEFRNAVGGHPIVAETLFARGVTTVHEAIGFLDPQLYDAASYKTLSGIEEATQRLLQAREQGQQICVWGDFDVDGQTSTALLVQTLRVLGCEVVYHIPHRERESHGVNHEHLARVIEDGAKVVLTCDTGIDALDAVDYARSRDVDFVITDHHDLPSQLPDAVAILNPKLLPEGHALRELPGVGVAFKLAQSLLESSNADFNPAGLLDLVALGIVADLALQVRDVRYLLQLGLRQLRSTQRAGLRALMSTAGVEIQNVTEEQVAFMLAPRLNALGRLSDAQPGVEFLLSSDEREALAFANKLEALNSKRRLLSDAVYDSAIRMLQKKESLQGDAAIVLENENWPTGVVGLVAGRLAQEFRKPVMLMGRSDQGLLRGSARSVEGIDISRAIASQADLLEGYGGHPMAAGLSMVPDRLARFKNGLDTFIKRSFADVHLTAEVHIDAYLPLDALDFALIADLERVAPFGPGNPPIVLAAKGLEIAGSRVIGKNDDHLLVHVKTEQGLEREVLWWNGSVESLPGWKFDLAYLARTSSYRGDQRVQLEWQAARRHQENPVILERRKWDLHDLRFHPNPLEFLHGLAGNDVLVWAEGPNPIDFQHRNRYQLRPAENLVIWTSPPDLHALHSSIEVVRPDSVYVVAVDPGLSAPEDFLNTLAGLVKYAIHKKNGIVALSDITVQLAHKESTVICGLELLAEMGVIDLQQLDGHDFHVGLAESRNIVRESSSRKLHQLLTETAAFRAFLSKVDRDWFRSLKG